MNMKAYFFKYLVCASMFLQVGCGGSQEVNEYISGGHWEGFNREEGASWCFQFEESGALSLTTLQKLPVDSWDSDWYERARLVAYRGTWQMADGRRIMMFADPEDIVTRNLSEDAEQLPPLVMSHFLIVTDISEQGFKATSHTRGGGGWIYSNRVATCPNYYTTDANRKGPESSS